LKTLAFILALLPSTALADSGEELATVPLPSLTRETIVGTWEAVIPPEIIGTSHGVYRIDINKGPDLYLVGVEFDVVETCVQLVAQGSDWEVSNGDVVLRFKTVPADKDSKAEEIVFKGSGVCKGEIGALHGTLTISGKPLGGFTGDIWFHKGSWTRTLQKASKEAEERIQKLRGTPKT
jgi:hypothetical protein